MGLLTIFRHSATPRITFLTILIFIIGLFVLAIHPSTRTRLIDFSTNLPTVYTHSKEYFADYISPDTNAHAESSNGPLLLSHAGIATVRKIGGSFKLNKHPILELIERGKQKAEEIQAKRDRVQSLEDAVKDYKDAFKMNPPEGFDAWFKLTQSLNSTTAPSLVPLAHETVLPFLALPPKLLRERVRRLFKYQAMCGIEIGAEGKTAEEKVRLLHGDDYHVKTRPTPFDWLSIIRDDYVLLPRLQNESEPVQIAAWVDDASFRMTDGDLVERAKKLARGGKVWDIERLVRLEKEAESGYSWAATCPFGSRPDILQIPEVDTSQKRFITDMKGSMSYCDHPELLRQNGELLMRDELPMRGFVPALVITRPLNGVGMVGPPTERVNEFVANPKPWSQKTDSRLLFRGQATGIYHIDRFPWRLNQRDRLSFLAHPKEDEMSDVLVDRSAEGGVVSGEQWSLKGLVKKYLDVGLVKQNEVWNCAVSGPQRFACGVDPEIWLPNCPGSGQACEDMLREHVWENRINRDNSQFYKYILDVDGYGWSSRWRKELSMGSMIIKTTIYNEWWTEQSVPWYHYVPGLYDYSDIFDIVAFFAGSPDGSSPGHDDLAEEIARQGREFAKDRLRWEDIRSYLFLLVLEYRRAWSDDREKATFKI